PMNRRSARFVPMGTFAANAKNRIERGKLRAHGGDRRSEAVKTDQPTNTQNDGRMKHGNTRPYTLARLDRDRPDLDGLMMKDIFSRATIPAATARTICLRACCRAEVGPASHFLPLSFARAARIRRPWAYRPL